MDERYPYQAEKAKFLIRYSLDRLISNTLHIDYKQMWTYRYIENLPALTESKVAPLLEFEEDLNALNVDQLEDYLAKEELAIIRILQNDQDAQSVLSEITTYRIAPLTKFLEIIENVDEQKLYVYPTLLAVCKKEGYCGGYLEERLSIFLADKMELLSELEQSYFIKLNEANVKSILGDKPVVTIVVHEDSVFPTDSDAGIKAVYDTREIHIYENDYLGSHSSMSLFSVPTWKTEKPDSKEVIKAILSFMR